MLMGWISVMTVEGHGSFNANESGICGCLESWSFPQDAAG